MKYTKDDFTGFFDNVKFFIKPTTATTSDSTEELQELEIKFVCKDCKSLISREQLSSSEGQYVFPYTQSGLPEYHKAIFFCPDCVQRHRMNVRVKE